MADVGVRNSVGQGKVGEAAADGATPWLLVAAVVTQALPFGIVRVSALGVLALIASLRLAADPRRLGAMRPPVLLVAFVVFACASLLWSIDPRGTARALVELIAVTVVGVQIALAHGWVAIQRGVLVACQILVVLSVAAEIAARFGVVLRERRSDLFYGIVSNPNVLAFVCVMTTVAVLNSERTSTVGKGAWTMVSLVLLYGSSSSGGWVYLVVSGVLAVVLSWMRRTHPTLRPAILIAAAVGVIVMVNSRAVEVISRLTGAEQNVTLSGRTYIWTAARAGIADAPVAGYGFEALREPSVGLNAQMNALWGEWDFERFNAHNGYLDLGLQLGLVGVALLVGALLLALGRMLALYFGGSLGMWPALTVLVILVYNMTETRLVAPLFVWLILAVLVVAARNKTPEEMRRPSS